MDENAIAKAIVDAGLGVHRALGPGLLESVYEAVLAHELRSRGFDVERQVSVPVRYQNMSFDEGFRADLMVNRMLIVELKCVEKLMPAHRKQLLTYIRMTNFRLGLLVNFGTGLFRDGVERIVNRLPE